MSERVHPDDPGFSRPWLIRLRGGFVPWISRNPSRDEFFWRYRWASRFCVGKEVLDVPCGMGWGTSLIEGASKVFGLDIDPDSIAEARERYGRRISFRVGSMAELPFPDRTLDVVICLEGIEHVPTGIASYFLKEASRVLRPDGTLLISSPFRWDGLHSGNPYHVHEYQPEQLRVALAPHFRIEEELTRGDRTMGLLYAACRVRSVEGVGKNQR